MVTVFSPIGENLPSTVLKKQTLTPNKTKTANGNTYMGINNNKNNLKNKYLKTLHFSVTQSQAPHLFN